MGASCSIVSSSIQEGAGLKAAHLHAGPVGVTSATARLDGPANLGWHRVAMDHALPQ